MILIMGLWVVQAVIISMKTMIMLTIWNKFDSSRKIKMTVLFWLLIKIRKLAKIFLKKSKIRQVIFRAK